MEDFSHSSASGENTAENGRKHAESMQENEAQKNLGLIDELAACKKELREKDRAIALLEEELKSLQDHNRLNEKEVTLERTTAEMEKAQEMATMGSWVLEVASGKVTWTPELHRMFGQDPSCPVPTMKEQEQWYTEKSYEDMVGAISRTIEDGRPYNLELEIIRRDGSTRIIRSIGEAERDESGRIVWLRGIAQDITDIKEAEAKLKLALEKEKTASIYKDQFLANMSHEIRTPLNGVVGFASLLREGDIDDETRDDYINTIENCSNQLLSLIDDIIDLAKIQAGEIKVEKQSFNLAKLLRETVATIEGTKKDKGKEHLRLVTCLPENSEELRINSDPLRIQQILINLLSNALKFSDQGTIEFGYELKNEAIEFFVKDEGIGIDSERKQLIFERFEHFEGTTTKYEGTGLGLSISKGLAELLGATISLESKLGSGSTFRLLLPTKGEAKAAHEDVLPALKKTDIQVTPKTVLVVEDELVNQKFIERVLQSAPHKVWYAQNGEQAVQIYRDNPDIEVVLMDIRMPIMNGDVAAQEILKINSNAKIIAQTAYAMQDELDELIRDGFVDYVTKPYKPQQLLELIKQWA